MAACASRVHITAQHERTGLCSLCVLIAEVSESQTQNLAPSGMVGGPCVSLSGLFHFLSHFTPCKLIYFSLHDIGVMTYVATSMNYFELLMFY